MNKTLLALYGLKFNPFSPELPTEALHLTPPVEQFCWRIDSSTVSTFSQGPHVPRNCILPSKNLRRNPQPTK